MVAIASFDKASRNRRRTREPGPLGRRWHLTFLRTRAVNDTKIVGPINYKPQLDQVLSSGNKLYRSLSEACTREYSLMGFRWRAECVCSENLSRLVIAISLECKNRVLCCTLPSVSLPLAGFPLLPPKLLRVILRRRNFTETYVPISLA